MNKYEVEIKQLKPDGIGYWRFFETFEGESFAKVEADALQRYIQDKYKPEIMSIFLLDPNEKHYRIERNDITA